jgi:hypothetical protein
LPASMSSTLKMQAVCVSELFVSTYQSKMFLR